MCSCDTFRFPNLCTSEQWEGAASIDLPRTELTKAEKTKRCAVIQKRQLKIRVVRRRCQTQPDESKKLARKCWGRSKNRMGMGVKRPDLAIVARG